jgi:hypothetical protein
MGASTIARTRASCCPIQGAAKRGHLGIPPDQLTPHLVTVDQWLVEGAAVQLAANRIMVANFGPVGLESRAGLRLAIVVGSARTPS